MGARLWSALTATAMVCMAFGTGVAAAKPSRYPNPGLIVSATQHAYNVIYQFDIAISPKSSTLSRYHLTLKDTCNPHNPDNPAAQEINDEKRAQVVTGCIYHSGRPEVFREKRSHMIYIDQVHFDYAPALTALGSRIFNAALKVLPAKAQYVHGDGIYAQANQTRGFVRYKRLSSVEPGQADVRSVTLRKGKLPQLTFWRS